MLKSVMSRVRSLSVDTINPLILRMSIRYVMTDDAHLSDNYPKLPPSITVTNNRQEIPENPQTNISERIQVLQLVGLTCTPDPRSS